MTTGLDRIEQLDEFLSRPNQFWLLGAGVSFESGIPLMYPLTERVLELTAASPRRALLNAVITDLPKTAHIEHVLSHLGDFTTLAKRNVSGEVLIDKTTYTVKDLEELHAEVSSHIAETVRWGFKKATAVAPAEIGSPTNPIVKISSHASFVDALINTRQSGLIGRRRPIKFFTINYDTLLEDALALGCHSYWDGFSGGALAFRNYRYGDADAGLGCRAHVIKLHGSIDWHLGVDGKVWRVRDRDLYPERTGRVLIYPQAIKYVATQRDPFSAQFDLFRRSLQLPDDNILAVCGYSFGDEHINQEIEIALDSPVNKTTLLVFCREGGGMPDALQAMRSSSCGKRVYVMTEKGLYIGVEGPFYPPPAGTELDWWTFAGVTNLLKNGVEGYVK